MKPYYILALFGLLMACGPEKKGNDLTTKKQELADLKKQQTDLTTKIKMLEGEVAKLDPQKAEVIRTKDVVVAPVSATTFKHFVELQGSVDAKNNVQVSPRSGGTVLSVNVIEGSNVRAGQVVARLDDQILRSSVAEIQTQLSLASTVFEKQNNLWKQQIGTEIQYIQAKSNKESLERRLATLNTQLSQSNVTAPISGVVDKVFAKVGMMGAPGVPMFTVVNLSKLKVIAKVADTYAGSVRKGDAVQIRFPDINKTINARISFVSTTVDPLSRTFTIEAPLPPGGDLKPNMLAQVKINDVNRANAVVIDQNLIQNTEKGQLVYVATTEGAKKIAKARTVKTGQSYGGQIEITAGLQAGDQLITQGYQEVVDGQPINF